VTPVPGNGPTFRGLRSDGFGQRPFGQRPESPRGARLAAAPSRFDGRGCGSPGLQGRAGFLAVPPLPCSAGPADQLHERSYAARCCAGCASRDQRRLPTGRVHARHRGCGPRHTTAPRGASCGGKNPIEVAAPWPFAAALLDLSTRCRGVALEDLRPVRATIRIVRRARPS